MITLDTPLKFTAADGGPARHITDQQWSLPDADAPGEWAPKYKTKPILCERGYHWCEARHAVYHLHVECYLFEPWGETVRGNDENVSQGGRLLRRVETWNDRTARLFAADCAAAVVRLCGNDRRARKAIDTARRYARGQATEAERRAAAKVAGAAVWDIAERVERDAVWGLGQADSSDAESITERRAAESITKRRAARAARGAAMDAARAATWVAGQDGAGAAAEHVARFAASAAAWSASRVAARKAQTALLLRYLNGEIT
jgi:hypothetical protein